MQHKLFIGPDSFALQLYPDNPHRWYADLKKMVNFWEMEKVGLLATLAGECEGRLNRVASRPCSGTT